MKFVLYFCTALFASALSAQEIMPCGWQASARNIVEPWDENTRTFANGDVRVVNLDTVEPAAGFAFLMIVSPPYDALGSRQCVTVGHANAMGFAGLAFDGLTSDYDPAIGLIFDVVVSTYDPETAQSSQRMLNITVNQATGEIGAQLR